MNKSDLFYLLSIFGALGLWAVALGLFYVVVEGVYFIYCKARGIKY